MREFPLDTSVTITLDGSGNGTAHLGPQVGVMWKPTIAGVHVSSATNFPTCSIYVGGGSVPGQLVDVTYTGNDDSSGKVDGTSVYPGHNVWAVWAGGDANAKATLSLFGTQVSGYRSGNAG